MKKYNVIWFDDQFDSLNIIRENASLNNIKLNGYSNAKDGIDELERNIMNYDAAIVDGKFYKKPGQSGDAIDDNALFEVGRAIDRLSLRKILPWFILSGQPSFTREKHKYAVGFKDNKVYDKLISEDLDTLWNDLKAEANQQEDTQIRSNFYRVFELCSDKYIGTAASSDLLAILKKENTISAFSNSDLYFNPLRKIMEDVFVACNKWGFLPEVFIKEKVALNESSKYLSGKIEKGYKLDISLFPKVISHSIQNILSICQPASHRLEIDLFVLKVNSPYLLLSTVYQLLDVLLWLKMYIDDNSDIELNKSRCHRVESITNPEVAQGVIEQDSFKNFHCSDIILTYTHIKHNEYKVGDTIRIIKTANNTNEMTMHIYSKIAISSEKI